MSRRLLEGLFWYQIANVSMLETFPSFDDQRGSKTISANYFCNDRDGIFEHAFGKATNVLPAAKLRVDNPLFPALLPYPFEETATVLGSVDNILYPQAN